MEPSQFEPIIDERPNDQPWPAVVWPPSETLLAGNVVELRPTTLADAHGLSLALRDPAAWEHIPFAQPAAAAQWQELVAGSIADRFPWTVRLTRGFNEIPAETVVGWSSFLEVSPHDARLEIGATMYDPRVWGSAVNPEAKLLLLTCAFESLGMGRVQLKTDVRNDRSQRAIGRIGATFEGILHRYQRRADNTVRDTALFAIVAEQWPDIKADLTHRLARD